MTETFKTKEEAKEEIEKYLKKRLATLNKKLETYRAYTDTCIDTLLRKEGEVTKENIQFILVAAGHHYPIRFRIE